MKRIRLVLVEPRSAANLAHCARVAANFGVQDVVVVNPACAWPAMGDEEARRIASAGVTLSRLEAFTRADSLIDALADCEWAVAFTRREGARREADLTVGAMARDGLARGGRVALVFGNEEFGLSAADVALCRAVCRIPTDESGVGSMNLSHAVAVALARVFEAHESRGSRASAPSSAPIGDVEAWLSEAGEWMRHVCYFDERNPDRHIDRLREIVGAGLRPEDLAFLRGLVSKTLVVLGAKSRGKRLN